MTPSSKCVSLETAKRLLAAGFPDKAAHLAWNESSAGKLHLWTTRCEGVFTAYAAPDATEIGELLPSFIEPGCYLTCQVQDTVMSGRNGYKVYYSNSEKMPTIWGVNEAEARAKMWLKLKENNLI